MYHQPVSASNTARSVLPSASKSPGARTATPWAEAVAAHSARTMAQKRRGAHRTSQCTRTGKTARTIAKSNNDASGDRMDVGWNQQLGVSAVISLADRRHDRRMFGSRRRGQRRPDGRCRPRRPCRTVSPARETPPHRPRRPGSRGSVGRHQNHLARRVHGADSSQQAEVRRIGQPQVEEGHGNPACRTGHAFQRLARSPGLHDGKAGRGQAFGQGPSNQHLVVHDEHGGHHGRRG